MHKTVGLDGQLLLSSRVNLWVKIISRCAKTFSSASCMCVEGRLKQQKIQGCWFVDGKVPSIRMQVYKCETFFLISFLNNVIESAKQKKIYTSCNLVLKPLLLLTLIKSNVREIKWRRSSPCEDNLQCLFGNWLDLSDLSTDREPKARNSNIASFWVSVLTSLFS